MEMRRIKRRLEGQSSIEIQTNKKFFKKQELLLEARSL